MKFGLILLNANTFKIISSTFNSGCDVLGQIAAFGWEEKR